MIEVVEWIYSRWGFPQTVVGAIDIMGFHSLLMQAVNDYRCLDVCIWWPGRAHDAGVLQNSSIYTKGGNGTLFPDC